MRWIVSAGRDISVNAAQLNARKSYIEDVAFAPVSEWSYFKIRKEPSLCFYCCNSDDGIEGTFITAHINQVQALCTVPKIAQSQLVVANTCIWRRMSHKKILAQLMAYNRNIRLWFAHQELSIDSFRNFRHSTTLINIGQFGFQTSFSERELYWYRKKGLLNAIKKAFQPVSPIILPYE